MENKYFPHHICLASVLLLLHLLVNMPVTLIIDTQIACHSLIYFKNELILNRDKECLSVGRLLPPLSDKMDHLDPRAVVLWSCLTLSFQLLCKALFKIQILGAAGMTQQLRESTCCSGFDSQHPLGSLQL